MSGGIEFQIRELLHQAEKDDGGCRKEVVNTLVGMGEPAIPILLKIVHEEQSIISHLAYAALVKMKETAIPALSREAENENAKIRQNALHILGAMGKLSLCPLLSKALKDEDPLARSIAAWGLANLAHENRENDELGRSIAEMLSEASKAETYFGYYWKILKALGFAGHPAAVPELLRVFHTKTESSSKMEVIAALVRIQGAEALPTLELALKDKNAGVRIHALEHLEKIGEPAIPAMVSALDDEDKDVKAFACRVLQGTGFPRGPADLKILIGLVKEVKKEGKNFRAIMELYAKGLAALSKRSGEIIKDKGFPKPVHRTQNKAERVHRIRRAVG